MASTKPLILAAAAAVLTSGCLFAGDAKWPKLQMPPEKPAASTEAPAPAATAEPDAVRKSPDDIRDGIASIGARLDLRASDIDSVQSLVVDQRMRFETAAAAAESAAPGSSARKDRWNEAQVELTRLTAQVDRLADLAESVRSDTGQLAELYASVAGDTSEPPSDTTVMQKLMAQAGRLLDRIRTERAEGERYIDGAQARLAQENPGAPEPKAPALPKDREAYIVFHLDRDTAGYEQEVRDAVTQALARKPDMMFDLYAVAGNAQDDVRAQDRAVDIRRIIRSMGVDESRISLTEIRLARETSPEVRIYIR